MTHHRVGVTNYGLTEREIDLVRQANQDLDMRLDGFYRINTDSFECDACGSRIPHNGKAGDDAVQDMFIVEDEVLCRLCADGFLDEDMTGLIKPTKDEDVARIDAQLNAELDREASQMMGKIVGHIRGEADRISGRGTGEGS